MSTTHGPGKLHTELPLPAANIKQIDGLQILRAVALVIVVWGHAGLPFLKDGLRPIPDFGIYGIDIFFVLSGFILSSVVLRTRKKPGPAVVKHFLLRRLVRIFPIYWVFCAIGVAQLIHRGQFSLGTYLPPLLLLPFPEYPHTHFIIDFSWTLVYEMYFYYLLSVVQMFTVRRAVQVLIGILTLSSLLPLVMDIRRPVLLVAGNPILLEFVFGAVVALAYKRWGQRRLLGIALMCVGVVASFASLRLPADGATTVIISEHYIHYLRSFTSGIPATLLVAGTVFWLPQPKGLVGRVALFAGNASYSAYVASGLVLVEAARIFPHVLSSASLALTSVRVACQILLTLLAVVVGMIAYQYVEWPMLRRMQTWIGK